MPVGALSRTAWRSARTCSPGYAQYYAPPAGGRAPLVILSSGCGGVVGANGPNRVMNNYAEAAARGGAYAIIVDGLQARGIDRDAAIRTVCSGSGCAAASGPATSWPAGTGPAALGRPVHRRDPGRMEPRRLDGDGAACPTAPGARRVGSLRVDGSEAAS
jgi:dienelactone hydrolase